MVVPTILAQGNPQVLNESTLVPIGVAVAAGLVVIGAVLKLLSRFKGVEDTIQQLTKQINEGWTRKDQEIFTLKLKLYNPKLLVPGAPDAKCGHELVPQGAEEDGAEG